MITFSIISYFDPYGDSKSDKKVFKRHFFNSNLTRDELSQLVLSTNYNRTYYRQIDIIFKNYKKTKPFEPDKISSL